MINTSETLAVQTIENFLTVDETAQVTKVVDDQLATTGWVPAHPSEGLIPPGAAQEILSDAIDRAMPVIRRAFPSAAFAAPWLYHDLRPGDVIRSHVHGMGDPGDRPVRLARVVFNLQDAESGGEFYLDTSASEELWTDRVAESDDVFAPGTRFVHEVTATSGPVALDDVTATRWVCRPPAGTTLVYGAQLIHGVTPVVAGRARKLITDLCAGPGTRPEAPQPHSRSPRAPH
ncbi:hypothetical protein [Streptomyces alkaliterrae]|uniref:Fe2OG dioxygenase domain-containing protein n=1 Tax=Streptomyces alkaliterrae TaxID=2213162 RepID=A0A5P0YW58_9ACTN|nr:hypothetical protein [Streptomyces alkaliterrae]MBB1254314.1 hypothetical protein [Streptomyces alkaliterrae]MBB1258126.1 hypothetical protein [Streptomyces alkaliterrae]MQS04525.1 hypothetical protein [Streptomyces alkaliterrae]